MQIEFEFEAEITVTQAEAGDLWPQVAAASHDPETAIEEGEVFLTVSAIFDGDDGDTIDYFDAESIRVEDIFVSPELAYFIEKQMREKRRAELNEYIDDHVFFDSLRGTERMQAVHRAVAQRRQRDTATMLSAGGAR